MVHFQQTVKLFLQLLLISAVVSGSFCVNSPDGLSKWGSERQLCNERRLSRERDMYSRGDYKRTCLCGERRSHRAGRDCTLGRRSLKPAV